MVLLRALFGTIRATPPKVIQRVGTLSFLVALLAGAGTALADDSDKPEAASDETASKADAPAATLVEAPKPPKHRELGFGFGSYGRVIVGTENGGASPEAVNVVTRGARIVEPTYLELDLYYRLKAPNDIYVTTVTTLAFSDKLFHTSGDFDSRIALRNFYLQAEKDRYGVWAGSRMYRGDQIYLLDYWALDDVNTVGAGGFYQHGRWHAAAHVGVNRLLDPFQFQERAVLGNDFEAEQIEQLDRQRYVATASGTYQFLDTEELKAKAKLYTEIQGVPKGTREAVDGTMENLPDDFGWTIGTQIGAYGFADNSSHLNLFARYSKGLTAYDELIAPTGVGRDGRVIGATELVLGFSGSYETDRLGVIAGGYTRRFVDADPNTSDRDDGWEYIVNARPRTRIWGPIEAAVDVSYQVRFPKAVSPNTLTAMDPAVFQVAPMLTYSPFGSDSLARPQFRLVYRGAHLNAGARDLYPMSDPRRDRNWANYFGVQAEWWFNSTSPVGRLTLLEDAR